MTHARGITWMGLQLTTTGTIIGGSELLPVTISRSTEELAYISRANSCFLGMSACRYYARNVEVREACVYVYVFVHVCVCVCV